MCKFKVLLLFMRLCWLQATLLHLHCYIKQIVIALTPAQIHDREATCRGEGNQGILCYRDKMTFIHRH